jgi:hypothetical protein
VKMCLIHNEKYEMIVTRSFYKLYKEDLIKCGPIPFSYA